MPLGENTKTIKVTMESKYKEGDIICEKGNINYEGNIYLWEARQSHYGMSYDVNINDNGKISSKHMDLIIASIRTSIEENIVETTYKINM